MPPRKRRAVPSTQRKSYKANSKGSHPIEHKGDITSRGRLSQEPSNVLRVDEELHEVEKMEVFDHIPAPPLKRKTKNRGHEFSENDQEEGISVQKGSEIEKRKKIVESFLRDTDLSNFSSTTFLAARFTEKLVRRISLEGFLNFHCRQQSISDELKRHVFDVSFNGETGNDKTHVITEQTGKQLSQGNVRSSSSNHSNTRNLTCSHCGSLVSSSRYAAHLEKCLGKGGRLSSRAASLRLRNSASEVDPNTIEDSL